MRLAEVHGHRIRMQMLCDGDDGVHIRTPHPSGISTTNMFSLRYACDNMGLCVRSRRDADAP